MTTHKRRRSPRYKGFDYTQPGAYFITICTKDRACLFGDVQNDSMVLNAAGRMIERWLQKIPSKFPFFNLDEAVVLPNHLHCVLFKSSSLHSYQQEGKLQNNRSLSAAVQWFKTMTTNEYIRGVKTYQWQPFHRKLWQRSYYDHVIRSEQELAVCRTYIHQNPIKWMLDDENLDAFPDPV